MPLGRLTNIANNGLTLGALRLSSTVLALTARGSCQVLYGPRSQIAPRLARLTLADDLKFSEGAFVLGWRPVQQPPTLTKLNTEAPLQGQQRSTGQASPVARV